MQRVSLKFLAKELGIAEGTVSRALNDYPDISDATRARVKKPLKNLTIKPIRMPAAWRPGLQKPLPI